jgi:hypothetical protein
VSRALAKEAIELARCGAGAVEAYPMHTTQASRSRGESYLSEVEASSPTPECDRSLRPANAA